MQDPLYQPQESHLRGFHRAIENQEDETSQGLMKRTSLEGGSAGWDAMKTDLGKLSKRGRR